MTIEEQHAQVRALCAELQALRAEPYERGKAIWEEQQAQVRALGAELRALRAQPHIDSDAVGIIALILEAYLEGIEGPDGLRARALASRMRQELERLGRSKEREL